jgi:hypothetical protein
MYHFILYKSLAVLPRDINMQTADIVMTSITNNRRDGITGFLHSEHGAFYQVIEGNAEAVNSLFERLKRDRRHFEVTLITSGARKTRMFEDFEMGFASAHGRRIADSFCRSPDTPSAESILNFMQERREELLDVSGA